MCMKSYDDTKLLYLETDASGVGLGAATVTDMSGNNRPEGHGA